MAEDISVDLKIDHEQHGAANIVKIVGDVRYESYEILRSRLMEIVADTARHLIINLEECNYICSQGLALLIEVKNSVSDADKRLLVVSPTYLVRRLLEFVGINNMVDIYDTQQQALDVLNEA